MLVDILFLCKDRLEFTKASFQALADNTNWHLVKRLIVYDDGSRDGTEDFLEYALFEDGGREYKINTSTFLRNTKLGSPVAIMNHFLLYGEGASAPLFAKIDNDTIVPPGWLDQCVATMERNPGLDLLGIEPPMSRRPSKEHIMSEELAHAGMMVGVDLGFANGFVHADSIGGLGIMRRSAFAGAQMDPRGLSGFNIWQNQHPEITRGWIVPPLNLFLLDRLPVEPWVSLSREYIAKGWQRHWWDYPMANAALWNWWWPSGRNLETASKLVDVTP